MDFKNFSTSPDSPSVDYLPITPSDTEDLSSPVTSLYVGTGGNLTIMGTKGNVVTFVGVGAGTVLPVAVLRVFATGTTATNIVGLSIGVLVQAFSAFIPLGSTGLLTSDGNSFKSVGI